MKNKSLKLSIVIPAYNEQDYLPACLDAVAAQTVKPDEVIVVNNNSQDRTAEIAQKYSFVELISEPRQGIVFARNRGFDHATSELIGRIDADTVLNPNWVEQIKTFFSEHERTSAVTGSCYFYDFPFRRLLYLLHTFVYGYLQSFIAGTDILWGSNMAIRQSAWSQVKGLCHRTNEGHEDVDLSLGLRRRSLPIARFPNATASVSMRRGELGLSSLSKYLARWHKTYLINGLYVRALFIIMLEALTMIGAILAEPINIISALLKNSIH